MIFPSSIPKEFNRPLLAYFPIPIIGPTTDFSFSFNVQQDILIESISSSWEFVGGNQPTIQFISNARYSWTGDPISLAALGSPGARVPGQTQNTGRIAVNYPYLSSEALIVRIENFGAVLPPFLHLLLWTRASQINNPFEGI